MKSKTIKFGSRNSPLAIAQAQEAINHAKCFEWRDGVSIELYTFKTTGDLNLAPKISEIGGKGVFCRELEHALLEGKIDVAVHSMKDIPVCQPNGLIVDCVLPRMDPRDAMVSMNASCLNDLHNGAKVATSSLRRRAQISQLHPQLIVVDIRGNIHTRLNKLYSGEVDAIILALAGLLRLKIPPDNTCVLSPKEVIPAPAQGAICLERRIDDLETKELLRRINHPPSWCRIQAERSFLAGLGGDCTTPVGALATIIGNQITLKAQYLTPDGSASVTECLNGVKTGPKNLGSKMAMKILAEASGRGMEIH